MNKATIEQQLNELFELEQQLCLLLKEQQYEVFQQSQKIFEKKIRVLLDNNSAEALNDTIDRLKLLKTKLATLKSKAESCFGELKEKTLQQRRNKNRIKAYR